MWQDNVIRERIAIESFQEEQRQQAVRDFRRLIRKRRQDYRWWHSMLPFTINITIRRRV